MLLEWNEQIKAHLMWIWGGEDGFMKRKKEGMFVVTERNLIFITKTNMSYRIHEVHSQRQLLSERGVRAGRRDDDPAGRRLVRCGVAGLHGAPRSGPRAGGARTGACVGTGRPDTRHRRVYRSAARPADVQVFPGRLAHHRRLPHRRRDRSGLRGRRRLEAVGRERVEYEYVGSLGGSGGSHGPPRGLAPAIDHRRGIRGGTASARGSGRGRDGPTSDRGRGRSAGVPAKVE